MTAVTLGMVAQLGLAVLALAAALVPSNRWRSTLVGLTCVALGLAGAATGVLALLGHTGQLTLDVPLTWAGGSGGSLTLAPSPLGGVFLPTAPSRPAPDGQRSRSSCSVCSSSRPPPTCSASSSPGS